MHFSEHMYNCIANKCFRAIHLLLLESQECICLPDLDRVKKDSRLYEGFSGDNKK